MHKRTKKRVKILCAVILAVLIAACAGCYIWTQQTFISYEELAKYVDLDALRQEEDWLVFEPEDPAGTGIILFPGAKVEPAAYSYYAKQLSDAGYAVYLPHVSLNLAFLDTQKAGCIMKKAPHIDSWIVGGHSLGGYAASLFALENPEAVDGLILLASSAYEAGDLSSTALPTLSLYGENDGIATPEKMESSKVYMSSAATLYEIKGANHAQFGIYGEQKNDGEAAISVKEQQDIMAEQTLMWLNDILH